jgi:hypothetical protein
MEKSLEGFKSVRRPPLFSWQPDPDSRTAKRHDRILGILPSLAATGNEENAPAQPKAGAFPTYPYPIEFPARLCIIRLGFK